MSTPWIIARQKGDGWEGRVVNNDGYPSHCLPLLVKIRDAFDSDVERMLVYYLDEHGAWSSIGTDVISPAGYREYNRAPDPCKDPDGFTAFFKLNRCFCHG